MPRELVALEPRKPALREYDDPRLEPQQIRIRTEFAAPKHGTELVGYRSDASVSLRYDSQLGCMVADSGDGAGGHFPRPLGNMAVGVVTETGADVTRFQAGQRVYGHFTIRETHTVDEKNADPLPEGLSPEAAVCLDPVVMGLGLRDASIRLGDHVAVFGLGAIGLVSVQLARAAGADQVIGVDPIEARRDLALKFGADAVIDPVADDAGLEIRKVSGSPEQDEPPTLQRIHGGYGEVPTQYGQRGVDVGIEVSGSPRALHDTIRATRFGGTICLLAMHGGDANGLRLGEEFHFNRQQLISARVESLPLRDAPAWTLQRIVHVALDWMTSGRVRTDGIVSPVVSFDESAEAYREIDEHPERSVKLGVRFP